MSTRRFVVRAGCAITDYIVCALLASASFFAQFSSTQSNPKLPASAPNAALAQEFPVTMRQSIIAGKTPVGTKVEAKLTIATLVKGAVIPEGAIFSGEVVDSTAKSKTDPSRLAIRMDSVQWKKESKPIKVYLTVWYYPVPMPQDADQEDCRTVGGLGMNCPTGPGAPGAGPGMAGTRFPPAPMPPPSAQASQSRVAMKDIESTRDADGTIALSSAKSNIKLDRTTTYVLATGELMPESKPSTSDRTK
jgi:hypothetical protein